MAKQNSDEKTKKEEKKPFEPVFIPRDAARALLNKAAERLGYPHAQLSQSQETFNEVRGNALESLEKTIEDKNTSPEEVEYLKEVKEFLAVIQPSAD